uniref:Uncharacterized protein n=1 Tax=Fagus sylvatica TaxID=28930 RepID=A0A2N9FUM3_FAGSY
MDARDSLSSSTVATVTVSAVTAAADAVFGVAPNRDGLSGTEDDAVLSVAAALAKDAALHFQSAKFAECVEVLNQLFLKKQDDPKEAFPELLRIARDKEALVANHLEVMGYGGCPFWGPMGDAQKGGRLISLLARQLQATPAYWNLDVHPSLFDVVHLEGKEC